MAPIRTPNRFCPVCLKPYKSDLWLYKHIDSDHPRYRAQLLEAKTDSKPHERVRKSSQQCVHNSQSGFHANHNHVDDPDAFPPLHMSPSPEPPELDSNTIANFSYPDAGATVAYVLTDDEHNAEQCLDSPFHPFDSEEEYNFAELVTSKGLPANVIDDLLKGSCGLKESVRDSLKSNYHLRQKIDAMEDGLGHGSWKKATLQMAWNVQHPDAIEFWHRDIIECAKWLLRQPAYEEHLTYTPKRCFNDAGHRVYNEMHTGDWWWDKQTTLPVGDTLVPMIFMSDATHLTNFSGDKKAWPIYMTIGNLSAAARMKHTMHSVLLVALLPIAIKMRDVPLKRRNAQREHNRMISQNVLQHVLQPLLNSETSIFYARCADGNFRHCYSTLAAWMADYPEHRDLHNIKNGVCYWCECPKQEMGNLPRQHERHNLRDHNMYRMLSDSNTPLSIAELKRHDVNPGFNILWYLDCVTSDLPKPDLLHTMQIGMLKHLLTWLHEFLKQHKRLDKFNDIWLSVPAYLDMTKPRCAYEEVSHWNGGEIKTMTRFLVGVVRNALRDPSPSQRSVFDRAVECSRSLIEFYFYCQYDSHDDETLDLMDNALRRFHDSKDVFQQFRAGKRLAAEAKERRTELCAERDAELNSEENKKKTAAFRQRIHDAWKGIIDAEMAEYIEDGSDFNFPKIHLMQHFREQIQRYGSLKQWSTEIGESSHRKQIKDGFNASNKTGDYYTQMINYYLRSDAFAVRKANRDAWNRKRAAPQVTTEVATDATTRRRLLRFISPQQHKGKEKVKDFQGLLKTISDDVLRNGLYDATRRFLHSKKVNIDSDDLLSSAAAIYHGLEVESRNMHGERIIQKLRCTGNKRWYSGAARHDWVWVQTSQRKEGQELSHKALQGRLPYRMLRLFKLRVVHSRGENTFWLAYVEVTKPANGGMPESASQLVRVVKVSSGGAYAVISAGNIVGAAHLIPEEPISSKLENKGWIVNSHIDLATWNDVYYMLEDELNTVAKRV